MNRRDSEHPVAGRGDGQGGHHPPSSVGPKATRIILTLFFGISAGLVVFDFFAHRHIEHPLENIPAFYTIWGLVGVGALIMAAKGLRRIVMRPEDYYDADR